MKRFDVAVIGGGIAGASAAFWLSVGLSADRSADRRVVLFEQESELAFHSTSRSAAVYLENYGGPTNHRLSTASRGFFENPPGAVDAPFLEPLGFLDVGPESSADEFAARAAEAAKVTSSICFLDASQIAELCPALRPEHAVVGVWEPDAMAVDVMAVHQFYVREARARGLQIERSSRVESLDRRDDRWKITTSSGELEASVVVNASGAWGDHVASLARAAPVGLTPRRRTAFTTRTHHDTTGWPFVHSGVVGAECYFKPEAGQQLLCSLADETATTPGDARPEELDIALAIDRLNALADLNIRSVATTWAGHRTFAPDRQPVIGWDDEADGFVWMVGQGGAGIVTSPASGMVVASLIGGEELPDPLKNLGLTTEMLGRRG